MRSRRNPARSAGKAGKEMKSIMERHANAAAQSASIGTVIFGGLSLNEVALVVGIVCSVGTLLINWWYKHKEFNRGNKP